MHNLLISSKTCILMDLDNDLILEHYLVLSSEMALKEQVHKRSVPLISIHVSALSLHSAMFLFISIEQFSLLLCFCTIMNCRDDKLK